MSSAVLLINAMTPLMKNPLLSPTQTLTIVDCSSYINSQTSSQYNTSLVTYDGLSKLYVGGKTLFFPVKMYNNIPFVCLPGCC